MCIKWLLHLSEQVSFTICLKGWVRITEDALYIFLAMLVVIFQLCFCAQSQSLGHNYTGVLRDLLSPGDVIHQEPEYRPGSIFSGTVSPNSNRTGGGGGGGTQAPHPNPRFSATILGLGKPLQVVGWSSCVVCTSFLKS